MNDERLDPIDFDALAKLSPDDPRILALPLGERARLVAYRDFVSPGSPPAGARVDEAERALGERLERELGVGDASSAAPRAPVVPARPPRAGGLFEALLGPRLRPMLAAAVVVVVAGGAWLFTISRPGVESTVVPAMPERPAPEPAAQTPVPSEPVPATPDPVMRGGENPGPGELTATARALSGGGLRLEWTPAPEAESYTIVFLSSDLVEIARITDLRATHLDLVAGQPPAGVAAGTRALWRVSAMKGPDQVARSRTSAITVP